MSTSEWAMQITTPSPSAVTPPVRSRRTIAHTAAPTNTPTRRNPTIPASLKSWIAAECGSVTASDVRRSKRSVRLTVRTDPRQEQSNCRDHRRRDPRHCERPDHLEPVGVEHEPNDRRNNRQHDPDARVRQDGDYERRVQQSSTSKSGPSHNPQPE